MKEASSDGAALLHVHAHSRHVHAQQDVGSEVRCGRVSGSEVKRPGWFCYCSPDVIKVLPPLLPSSFPHLLLSILPLHPSSLPSVIRPSTFPKTSNFLLHIVIKLLCLSLLLITFLLLLYLFCFCPPDPTHPDPSSQSNIHIYIYIEGI